MLFFAHMESPFSDEHPFLNSQTVAMLCGIMLSFPGYDASPTIIYEPLPRRSNRFFTHAAQLAARVESSARKAAMCATNPTLA